MSRIVTARSSVCNKQQSSSSSTIETDSTRLTMIDDEQRRARHSGRYWDRSSCVSGRSERERENERKNPFSDYV